MRQWKFMKIFMCALVLCSVVTILFIIYLHDHHSENETSNSAKNTNVLKTQLSANAKFERVLGTKSVKKPNQSLGEVENSVTKKGRHLKHVLNYNVHTFYYPWYGNPQNDKKYLHWNHQFIQHWDKNEAKKWPKGVHEPPEDIGSNYYPQLGPYSSRDPRILYEHMKDIAESGIGVLAVSVYPPGDGDNEETRPDKLMPLILDAAARFNLKVIFHIEPFKNRNPETMRAYIEYILQTYGNHSAFYRHHSHKKKKSLPLMYIYDSYQTKPQQWARLFKEDGDLTVRNTPLDGIYIGLLVEREHRQDIFKAAFDGFYTYFATDKFTYGSSWSNWKDIAEFAERNNLIFIPSVGPGYIDTQVRPWNNRNTRLRKDGEYYKQSFTAALSVKPEFISITSFNEWHEGTQIEPAIPKVVSNREYLDYGSHGSHFYLELTKQLVKKF